MLPAFIPSLGWTEIIIIGVVGVLLFGKRLPDLGKTLGKSLVSFRKGMSEMKDEITKGAAEPLDDADKIAADKTAIADATITEIKIGDQPTDKNDRV